MKAVNQATTNRATILAVNQATTNHATILAVNRVAKNHAIMNNMNPVTMNAKILSAKNLVVMSGILIITVVNKDQEDQKETMVNKDLEVEEALKEFQGKLDLKNRQEHLVY